VRAAFKVDQKPSRLVVDFGCDLASGDLAEVVFERGSGHGGSLDIVRMKKDGDVVHVRAIESSHYYNAGTGVRAGEMAAATLETMVARSRVAMLAKPHLISISVENGGHMSGSYWGSSNDFTLGLRIVDTHGDATERSFTGYEGSMEQENILPMRLATEPFEKLLESLSLAEVAPDDEDARFFTARFVATMAGHPYWWVKERYVALAARLGTPDAVPALVAVAREHGDASADRARDPALEAITRITGWDPRVDAYTGKKLDVDHAAERAARECAEK
jgi:hypothetical protein